MTIFLIRTNTWSASVEIPIQRNIMKSDTLVIEDCMIWTSFVSRDSQAHLESLIVFNVSFSHFNLLGIPEAIVRSRSKMVNYQGNAAMIYFLCQCRQECCYDISFMPM